MDFSMHRITGYADNIKDLPDKIEDRAAWLKAKFDGRTDAEVKAAVNGLIDQLNQINIAGIHIGDDPPDDRNINLWIDTSETPDTVLAADRVSVSDGLSLAGWIEQAGRLFRAETGETKAMAQSALSEAGKAADIARGAAAKSSAAQKTAESALAQAGRAEVLAESAAAESTAANRNAESALAEAGRAKLLAEGAAADAKEAKDAVRSAVWQGHGHGGCAVSGCANAAECPCAAGCGYAPGSCFSMTEIEIPVSGWELWEGEQQADGLRASAGGCVAMAEIEIPASGWKLWDDSLREEEEAWETPFTAM